MNKQKILQNVLSFTFIFLILKKLKKKNEKHKIFGKKKRSIRRWQNRVKPWS